MTIIDFKALGAKAAAEGADMTKAKAGGGDYTPPAEGFCKLRFIGYIEVGKHTSTYKGVPKTQDKVQLIFEVSGPKHQPRVDDNGNKIPLRITIEENLSLNEKANFFKLFQRMNYAGTATHMVQLLGEAFLGTIYHDKWKGQDGKERVTAVLRNPADGAYSIRPPRVDDPETGEPRPVQVDPVISPLRYFLWNYADKASWDSLFIDGEYPERRDEKTGAVVAPAKSKNVLQNKIKSAVNYEGSGAQQVSGGQPALDLPPPESGRDALSTKPSAPTSNQTGSYTPPEDADIPF
jgi:hypothetical protein